MPNYYECLGVDRQASPDEIKKAYKQKVLKLHPDKIQGHEEAFRQLQEAYETLSNPEKREAYDRRISLANPGAFFARLRAQGLRFYLVPNPDDYDHYQYVNALFRLKGEERLFSGQVIVNQDALWEKISYVATLIAKNKRRLKYLNPKPTGEVKAWIELADCNMKKLSALSPILCSCIERKKLYDLSLGLEQSTEMLDMLDLIGGQDILVKHIKEHPSIPSLEGIFALYQAHLLTPFTFNQLIHCKNLSDVSLAVDNVFLNRLLTPRNFSLLIKHEQHANQISCGIDRLELAGIMSQWYFEILISAGKNAKMVGSTLEELYDLKLLNKANFKVILNKIPHVNIWPSLSSMKNKGLLTQERTDALHWQGPEEAKVLLYHLDKLVAHGLFLLSCDEEKGKQAMLFALDLKKELKWFFEKSPQEQQRLKGQFKTFFITQLHACDQVMSVHRAQWKIILANILIACTGLGLVALGINVALTGHVFFGQTKRERCLQKIQTDWSETMQTLSS